MDLIYLSDFASPLYSEISTAENKLKGIRSRFFATETPNLEADVIMKYESWSKCKHLFLKDLSSEEWNLVDTFYNNCSAYDAAVTINKTNISQIVKANYKHQYDFYAQAIATFHKAHPDAVEPSDEVVQDILKFQKLYLSDKSKNPFDYVPRQGVAEARNALVSLDTSVSAASAGQRLKKIAKL